MKVMTDQEIVTAINDGTARKFIVQTGRNLSERELLRIAGRCQYDSITEIKNALVVEKKIRRAIRF